MIKVQRVNEQWELTRDNLCTKMHKNMEKLGDHMWSANQNLFGELHRTINNPNIR